RVASSVRHRRVRQASDPAKRDAAGDRPARRDHAEILSAAASAGSKRSKSQGCRRHRVRGRTMSADRKDPRQAIRRLNIIGFAALVVLVGGVGGWAATAPLAGAVIAPGALVVESN